MTRRTALIIGWIIVGIIVVTLLLMVWNNLAFSDGVST